MFSTALVAVVLAFVHVVSASVQQAQFSFATGFDSYDAGLFTPLEDLSLLSSSEFTTLGHPAFPKYEVRIKKSDFCDGTVKCVPSHLYMSSLRTHD